MTGFELQTSGITLPTEPQPLPKIILMLMFIKTENKIQKRPGYDP